MVLLRPIALARGLLSTAVSVQCLHFNADGLEHLLSLCMQATMPLYMTDKG